MKKLWLIGKYCRCHLIDIFMKEDRNFGRMDFNLDKMLDDGEPKEDLIKLQSNHTKLQSNYNQMLFAGKTLEDCWCSAMVMFPIFCETALVVLTSFATTCNMPMQVSILHSCINPDKI